MTSPANPQNSQAPTPSAASVPSYASAAGASKKPASTPSNTTGSNTPPVVVGGASAQQHAKSSGPSPVNGRPAITPAVPTASQVANGSSSNPNPSINMNGATADHSRKSSVTISANGPGNQSANGGASKGIKFGGFESSPAIAHSSPAPMASNPISIPGGNTGAQNQSIPSPAHSPSPIPQPSASGGRPPSGMSQQNTQMTFGSLGSDGDRHMRQGSVPPQNPAALSSQPGAHIRRESAVSQHSDMSGPGGNRPNFGHQGGRGRGGPGFNPQHPQYNNANMGYPPNFNHQGGRGRGGPNMPPAFQPGRPMTGYPNSPGPGRSPALAHAQPGHSQPGTPNMHQIQPIPAMTPPQYHYSAPNMPQQQFGYPPYPGQFDPRHSAGYVPHQYMPQPGHSPGAANFQPGHFNPPPFHAPGPASMSRTSSHSDRPPSSTGQTNQAPVVVSGSQQNGQQKAGLPSGFRAPKKSAAIQIKNAQGEAIDISSFKAPVSPSPSIQQSKTPPVVASTPPPTQKAGNASAHGRNESVSAPKTAKEIQEELRAKIMAAAHSEDKNKEAAPAKPAEEEKKPEPKPVEEKKEEVKPAPQPEPAAKAPESVPEAKKEEPAAAAKPEEPEETEEERFEREIREMEELEAQREKEAAEYEAKKKARLEEEKKQAEAKKATSAADEDRKLREAEAEAERLELEKERKRAEAEASGSAPSLAELLAKSKLGDATESGTAEVTDKLANLSLDKDSKPAAAEKPRGAKPPALNLAPLNTKPVEPPQPSAALQSLKSARFLTVMKQDMYPTGIQSPNPALNAAVAKKGKAFKYDAQFLLQFQKVFTEQPSMEFGQQVKSLIGDNDGSRSASTPRPGNSRQASRSGAAFPAGQQNVPQGMGNFVNAARGTTSAERFARSNAASGMGSFGRTGSFPMGASMSRSASSANMGGPSSPRTGSRRGPSRRGGDSAKEAQAAKTMPLTAGQELKPIQVSATGWKPQSIGNKGAAAAPTGHMEPEMVQRKVKSNLNKMTPEKFDKIADQILEIAAQSKNESDGRTLRQVIQLTFEKATDEAHWASMYAKFCKRMLDTMSPEIRDETLKDKNGDVVCGGALFRKYLLNRCQEEFERGWKTNLPEKPAEDDSAKPTGEAAMLSEEYYIAAAAKRRGLGLVQFIGELYKLGMLTERIMHACVQKLVDYETMPEEAEIESLSKLLRTIGGNLDANPKGKGVMDAYFNRIQGVVDMPDLPSRLKFMLMDVIDLRKQGWNTKEDNKGPKTLEEVRAEAEAAAAAKAQENARSNQRGGPRPNMGRGDARSFSHYQQNSNQVGMDDLRRLTKGAAGRTASGAVTLGPTSMFSSRSNSGRRLGPGGSLGRAGEDSGASSRTGTPPTTHTNAFSALANLESENPASPPSTAASPALTKAVPDSSASESK